MPEKELLDKIRVSAEQIEIPESLMPDAVARRCKKNAESSAKKHSRRPFSGKQKIFFGRRRVLNAAAASLFLLLLTSVILTANNIQPETSPDSAKAPAATNDMDFANDMDFSSEEVPAASGTGAAQTGSRKNAGSLYTVAADNQEIYNTLKTALTAGNFSCDDAAYAGESSLESAADKGVSQMQKQYSGTNLQTTGVDEGDSVKTDGRYIYTLTNTEIHITDTSGSQLEPAGSVSPDLDASDSLVEFYVADNKLLAVIQHYEAAQPSPLARTKEIYAMNAEGHTLVCTYDITDPAAPILEGTFTQDGYYRTSRRIDDQFYLFTTRDYSAVPIDETTEENMLPCVNEKQLPSEDVYLSDQGSSGLIISSMDIKHPTEAVDHIMILNASASIYMAENTLYLYSADSQTPEGLTQIAGFSMNQGKFDATGAIALTGYINDTFAIHAYEDQLRVVTTATDETGTSSNQLYLLDENLTLIGSLRDIAKGERLYAARFLDHMAYFITYQNTDPLFAVDLSDPADPKILGEQEITGFSEYLHIWKEEKLLGLGYETDPDTGSVDGLKLVMFDISNPSSLKTADSTALPAYSFSPALYDYKNMLADPDENLMGFCCESIAEDGSADYDYLLYSFTDGHFVNLLTAPLPKGTDYQNLRGLYIGDSFYLANTDTILRFDRNNGYQQTQSLTLN